MTQVRGRQKGMPATPGGATQAVEAKASAGLKGCREREVKPVA